MKIVKIGGSVASNLYSILSILKDCGESVLIVPGGWIFANLVRRINPRNDSIAHWMAVLAMEQYGYYISSFGVDTVRPRDFNELSKIEGSSSVWVLLPYELMKNNDELPHSWDVTSDSIAVWIASKLEAKEVIKLTDVDGIILNGRVVERIRASELAGIKTCVDPYAPKLMVKHGVDMFVCNGLAEERVKYYITEGRAKGTLIEGR